MKSIKKLLLLIAVLIIVAIVGTIGKIGGRKAFEATWKNPDRATKKQVVSSKEFLLKVASELNESLPIMVNKETQLTNVLAFDAELIYYYVFVNYSSTELDGEQEMSTNRPSVVNRVCTEPGLQFFLKNGVSLTYRYRGNDNKFIGKITVKPSECGF